MTKGKPAVEKAPEADTAPEPGEAEAPAVTETSSRAEELLTKLKYLQAEFENYRKRVERDAQTIVKFAHEGLLSRLLPVVDELDAAVSALDGETGKGVRMVRDNLMKALREAGLQEVPALGQPFDPYLMDAVQQVSDKDSKDGIVKEVLQKGYRLHERVLRPAQVIVVRNQGDTHG
ncbi:MAG: nucleotide exchange factor GrpE [Methanobacteriota archaeon]|nr:MAG: nucleotide exchange factor GrpE [Euryarchaeota archaeon]